MTELTQERLKELLYYNAETGRFIAKVSRANLVAGCEAGYRHYASGHHYIMIDYKKYKAHRLAWFYCFGRWPEEIDHINGIGNDNRLSNLRECSHTQNMMNTKVRYDNVSGEKGVYWDIKNNKWRSYITVEGRRIWLGRHVNFADAVAARKAAEDKYFGDFARKN